MALVRMMALVVALGALTEGQGAPTTPYPVDIPSQYDVWPNSAISMDGNSYHVNFDTPYGNLSYILRLCYEHKTCVSLDYDGSKGWMHRIVKDCASTSGAEFKDDSSGSTFYQLNAAALLAKGLNKTRCSHVKEAYEPDYGTTAMVGRLFGATAGTFLAVWSVLYSVQSRLASRDRARIIEGIIDADEGMDDLPMIHAAPAGHAHRRPNPQPQPQPQGGYRPQPNP